MTAMRGMGKKKDADCVFCDPRGARTLDPQIKSLLLYQLSYGVIVNGLQR